MDEGTMRLVFLGLSFRTGFNSNGCESGAEAKSVGDVLGDLVDYLVGLHQHGPFGGREHRHVETGGSRPRAPVSVPAHAAEDPVPESCATSHSDPS
jgi:hypothetical protein